MSRCHAPIAPARHRRFDERGATIAAGSSRRGARRGLVPFACRSLTLAAVACHASSPAGPGDGGNAEPIVTASTASTATRAAASAAAGGGSAQAGGQARHIQLSPAPSGDVASIVRDELARAATESRRLVVYVGASWCEPCVAFHRAAERGDLDPLFGDLTLLEFDLDRDVERLHAAAYASRYIPLFALPRSDGAASGRQIEGAIKGNGAVAFIAPRLARLLEP
jgi:hypothetical protein